MKSIFPQVIRRDCYSILAVLYFIQSKKPSKPYKDYSCFIWKKGSIPCSNIMSNPPKNPSTPPWNFWRILGILICVLSHLCSIPFSSYKHTQNPPKTHQSKSRYNPLNSNNLPFRNFVVWLGGSSFWRGSETSWVDNR